ncbi:Uncharacterised protein [Klebsiella pneumoniae]|nr:hypothetical protein [Klebsiella pneumoniae subsp. ozaenae]STR99467.1 Uncharacterised protein [Klebsiella pneumoniae]HBY9743089.1 hypothetical protein [Klebsiella pneumoniae]HBY9792768.1 hypothetical protein [Klebsiella pneumoniae]HDH0770432.1 hypothetical protein [Klebsiella pneumoniae]
MQSEELLSRLETSRSFLSKVIINCPDKETVEKLKQLEDELGQLAEIAVQHDDADYRPKRRSIQLKW